ncbi:protein of unknown function [Taphrina deformans PYCC 5710]|uniref:DNA-directed RNA polymerases I and III subunit RPAC1 n=1 Tax=Taphrina deformans (strain PYCC 5710 / ATCC 11124 / CBS 356.35 / IMI 108563 / JCM 9778 / NBRC 8474) TaxID=1097556 RepID=R4XFB4_TAPDE|nr:protein of unknown function [Taphrina deformans PYCC 5710]|eukprot:CCG84358.1 protein of unknown function [Taphrina deformans PYCC 5710]
MAAEDRLERLERRKHEIGIEIDRVTDVTSTDFPGHYPDEDNSWDIEKFKKQFFIQIRRCEENHLEFDAVGIDASIANAVRRILISEIPTMAIEYVYIMNNTSVIQDEVLAHRLGLIPISAPASEFAQFKRPAEGEAPQPTDADTVVLSLNVKCERNKDAPADCEDPKELYINGDVTSGMIKWTPMGEQSNTLSRFKIGPTQDDILIAKLRPGQEIDLEMHAILGLGQDHAKFSPVAPATYRIMPTITILEPIEGDDAEKFKKCFPKGVIKVIPDNSAKGGKKAIVRNPRNDSVSRECLRHEEFKDKVRLGRKRNHFLFSVESTGVADADVLVLKAITVLRRKCEAVKMEIERQRGDQSDD